VRGEEIGHGLPRGKDRSRPGRRGVKARQVGKHADLDRIVGRLRLRGGGCCTGRKHGPTQH
jgi:hypothetical protein